MWLPIRPRISSPRVPRFDVFTPAAKHVVDDGRTYGVSSDIAIAGFVRLNSDRAKDKALAQDVSAVAGVRALRVTHLG